MNEEKRNKKIAKRIIEMADAEQKLRNQKPIDWSKLTPLDTKNRVTIKRIINRYGLISISKFGKEASNSAWLLVQHFPPTSINFMKKYLKLMKENPSEVDPKNIAYLEDRINAYSGKPQIYGTQLFKKNENEKWKVRPIKDVKNVDKRRKKVGLEPLHLYIKKRWGEGNVILPEGYEKSRTSAN